MMHFRLGITSVVLGFVSTLSAALTVVFGVWRNSIVRAMVHKRSHTRSHTHARTHTLAYAHTHTHAYARTHTLGPLRSWWCLVYEVILLSE